MPATSYILDMMKAVYVTHADPSTMGRDPVNGLQEKERDLAKLTHEYLALNIPDYEEQEARIAATMGSKLTDLMLGLIDIEELSVTPPTITFSNFELFGSSSSSSSSTPDTNIYAGKQYYLDAIISGGNMNLAGFTYEWAIIKQPVPGTVNFTEYSSIITETEWLLTTLVEFTEPGTYAIQLRITNNIYTDVVVVLTTNATVLALFDLEIT